MRFYKIWPIRLSQDRVDLIKQLHSAQVCQVRTKSSSTPSPAAATTAHAVLALNKEDGGNRKFILVECEDYADDHHRRAGPPGHQRRRRGRKDKASLQGGVGGLLHLLHPGQSH